ncbi:MAG: class I SAM-dependent methyltransferase [Ignavibacteriaceae bacterium]
MNNPEPINFNTVADIYDIYVNIDTDIPFFLKETENFSGEILELMCGTGRVSIPLLEAKRKLVCVDYSEGMLESFRNKIIAGYKVELIRMDVTELSLNRKFGLIILPFHSLSEILTKEKQKNALIKISEHLKPGGTFICTLQNPKARLKTADGSLRSLGEYKLPGNNKLAVSFTNQWNSEQGIITGYQYYEIISDKGDLLDKRMIEINFRLVTDYEFREMIKETGMQIAEVYGDYSYSSFNEDTSSFMIYKLVKQ